MSTAFLPNKRKQRYAVVLSRAGGGRSSFLDTLHSFFFCQVNTIISLEGERSSAISAAEDRTMTSSARIEEDEDEERRRLSGVFRAEPVAVLHEDEATAAIVRK